MKPLDPKLREFCTVRQLEIFEALEKHASERKAAAALGVGRGTLRTAMVALQKKAALRGYSPTHDLHHPVAPGQSLRGASTLYKDGKAVMQWVKSTADADKQREIIQAAAAAMAEELPRSAPVAAPAHTRDELATVYTLTDSHVGAMAWREEGGADWDLKIAEATLVGCFGGMIAAAPPARLGVVAQLGDFLHADGIMPVTPTSGHILDADGRFTKVVQVAVRVLRQVVGMALQKHERVVVLMAEGNHDISSSIWLRTMFAALYEHEPRVEVIDSPLPYYAVQHGKTMLCWHHGHLKKNDQLPLLFASQFPAMWGLTTKRYAHCGHRHHAEEKEHSGLTVIQHPTLAARDAYAARGGWHAERQATAITYHAEFGQVARNTVTPEMV
jgi:hypothetical protein